MQIIDDYRALHQIPELDRQLPKTLQYIHTSLSSLRCRVFSPAEGALAAFFDFGQPETLAFRADIDALPLQEQTDLPWRSDHPGQMHACGHDGHTAILLELARRIAQRQTLKHNLLLLFQPAEETTGGAAGLCASGILEEYAVKTIFGLHLYPGLAAGKLYTRGGAMMAGSSQVQAVFHGRSGHIADGHTGGDALEACCRFYTRACAIRKRETFLLKFGQLQGGTAANIRCQQAAIFGSLRALEESTLRSLQKQLTGISKRSAYLTGCQSRISFSIGYPPVRNDAYLCRQVQALCPYRQLNAPLMISDDFAVYQQYVPGVYFLLGIGNTPPLHSAKFSFDPGLLQKGADYCQQLALLMPRQLR